MSNDMIGLLETNPDQPMVAYLAAAFEWNDGWTEHNQRLIDALAPLGYVIDGGPAVDIAVDSHPSLDRALRGAAEDTEGHAALVAWVTAAHQASGGRKNPATYVPRMMATESGRAELVRVLSQP